jgi:hypothetical protein
MTEHTVFLSDAESQQLPGPLLIVRPFPQAIMHYPNGTYDIADAVYPARESGYIAWYGNDAPGLAEFTKQQYKDGFANPLGVPGDVLVCKEAWYADYVPGHPVTPENRFVLFRASASPVALAMWRGAWRSAPTMPLWAVRHRPIVIEAGMMRVHDLTDSDAKAMGVFPAHLYSNVTRAEHGGSEYACAYHEEFNRRWGRRVRFEHNPWCWRALVEVPR